MMRVRRTAFVNFVLAAVFAAAAGLASDASAQTAARRQTRAQGQSRPAPPRPVASPAQREPRTPLESEADASADVSITARVTAESLRFEKVPNPRVEFTGRPRRETAWESERENLPQEVRPGETYRNIGITLHIRSVFADIDRIVAEALGEVPVNDGAQPSPAQPSPTPPAQPAAAPPTNSTTPPAKAAASAPRREPARAGRGN